MIVLDASALAESLLGGAKAAWVDEQIDAADSLHALHLIDIEVASAVRGHALGGRITDERGRQALADLAMLRLIRYPATALLDRIWDLREKLSAYDAAYVALAESLDAPLVTTDRRLACALGHRARVEAFPGRDA